MKKEALSIFLLLMSVSFASAAGLGDLFNFIDESTVILTSVFIISFALIFFSLSRSLLKTNTAIAGIIAGTLAFGITYGINRKGFDIGGFFDNIGISEEILMILLISLIIAGAIFLIVKLRSGSLAVFGGLFILLSFFAYNQLPLMVLGIVLLVTGLILLSKRKKKDEFAIPLRRR